MALGPPAWALVLLLALKIAMDLRAHVAGHRVNADDDPQDTARSPGQSHASRDTVG